MLYETAARSAEVLALDVEDLDLPNRQARSGKIGAIDVIIWQTGTARLLPRLLKGRKSGRCSSPSGTRGSSRPRPTLAPAAAPRLSYQQAAPVLRGLRRRDPAPAPALRAYSRRRGSTRTRC
jgi:integrase/recombinase XerC/integrase/recombinase XerD